MFLRLNRSTTGARSINADRIESLTIREVVRLSDGWRGTLEIQMDSGEVYQDEVTTNVPADTKERASDLLLSRVEAQIARIVRIDRRQVTG